MVWYSQWETNHWNATGDDYYDYNKMAQYGLHVQDVNQIVRSRHFAGERQVLFMKEISDLIWSFDWMHRIEWE